MTGFANAEEEFSDSFVGQKVMPWRVEGVLTERGANYIQDGLFKAFAVRDGRLITGPRQAISAGQEVKLSFSRDPSSLSQLAGELGDRASPGTPADAVEFGDGLVLSVPWGAIPQALEQARDLGGKVVVDTTNQFGSGSMPSHGQAAAAFNARRMPAARYVKSFNMLTARFQEQNDRPGRSRRVVKWICGDDQEAKKLVARPDAAQAPSVEVLAALGEDDWLPALLEG